jgi:transcriptional regulator with XRE-family HTH domain
VGLRREEVAQLAGIGVDWYIRLEQGRSVTPSAATVNALGRALKLNEAELAHLRALTMASDRRLFTAEVVPEAVHRIVEELNLPAYITGRRWDVLAWNAAADTLFGFSRTPQDSRNTLINMLTRSSSRRLFGDGWANEARRMLAQFRASHDLWAGDPAFQALLDTLRAGCPEFEGWWETHDVRDAAAGRKLIVHPQQGPLEFEYATFQANDDPALKLVMYTLVA